MHALLYYGPLPADRARRAASGHNGRHGFMLATGWKPAWRMTALPLIHPLLFAFAAAVPLGTLALFQAGQDGETMASPRPPLPAALPERPPLLSHIIPTG